MSRFETELENMPLENDIVKLLNDTLEKENKTTGKNKIRPLFTALYGGGPLPVEIAGKNDMIFSGHQYGNDFETATRVWRLYDYHDKESEQVYVTVSIDYDSSSYDGDDFESVEFEKVYEKEIVVKVYR